VIAAAYMAVVDLLARLGRRWDPSLAGCLELDIDERWHVALNGAPEVRADASGSLVPGLTHLVRCYGSPVGMLTPVGGVFFAGNRDAPGSAERDFIKACKAAGPQPEPTPEPAPQPQQMPLGGLN
jgi:hypothetical protein